MVAKTTAPAGTGGHEVPQRGAHPAREQSAAAGKAARQLAPLASHRDFSAAASRDPLGLLLDQAKSRVPELVPVRHGRMLVSPFAYYRGAALPMAADLAGTRSSGLWVQLCGDAHLLNFGAFASPERRLVFDLNDFDETLPGPFEYDVKRMAASFLIAGRNNGFSKADARAAALASVMAYRETMTDFAQMPTMAIWYAHFDEDRFHEIIRDALGEVSPSAKEPVKDKSAGGKDKKAKAAKPAKKAKPAPGARRGHRRGPRAREGRAGRWER